MPESHPDPAPNAAGSGPATSPGHVPGWHRWVMNHDQRWSFTLVYVALAVTLSIVISLFWLVAVVAVHGAFECYRQRQLHPGRPVAGLVVWELKLDIALVLLAMAMAVYMEFILGLAGIGGAARLGAQGAQGVARAAGWSRGLRGVLLSLDDAAHLVRMTGGANDSSDGDADPQPRPWRSPVLGDKISIGLAAISLFSVLFAPLLPAFDWSQIAGILLAELHPWPTD